VAAAFEVLEDESEPLEGLESESDVDPESDVEP